MNIREFKELFDEHYLSYLDSKIHTILQITENKEYILSVKHVEKLARGGKRIRPYLAFLSSLSAGNDDLLGNLHYLMALELIHLFALIHDDIMDNAELRRGVPTIQSYYEHTVGATKRASSSMAILIGDLVYTWAIELIMDLDKKEIKNSFVLLLEEVISGQAIDIVMTVSGTASAQALEEKNKLKTSSYTFMRPMQIGVLLAGGDKNLQGQYIAAGEVMGEAFQVIDDVKDIFGNGTLDYKDLCGDIETNQQTRISNYIRGSDDKSMVNEFNELCGRKLSDSEKDRVREIAIKTGAIEDSMNYAQLKINQSLTILRGQIKNQQAINLWEKLGQKIISQVTYDS